MQHKLDDYRINKITLLCNTYNWVYNNQPLTDLLKVIHEKGSLRLILARFYTQLALTWLKNDVKGSINFDVIGLYVYTKIL